MTAPQHLIEVFFACTYRVGPYMTMGWILVEMTMGWILVGMTMGWILVGMTYLCCVFHPVIPALMKALG